MDPHHCLPWPSSGYGRNTLVAVIFLFSSQSLASAVAGAHTGLSSHIQGTSATAMTRHFLAPLALMSLTESKKNLTFLRCG